jgi:hypothetical protein
MRWPRQRPGSKKKAQQVHARRRARERYNVYLSNDDLDEMCRAIQGGETEAIERQSNRVTVHRVTMPNGASARAVYDSKRKQVVTFLPREEENDGA